MTKFRNSVKEVVRRALECGARQLSPFEVEWDVSGDCETPVRREIFARKSRPWRMKSYRNFDDVSVTFENGPGQVAPGTVTYFRDDLGPYAVQLTARCRRCARCLRIRGRDWALRASTEIADAKRTWFGTFTLEPAWQYHFQLVTAQRLASRGVDFYALNGDEQLVERHSVISREITLMFKRMRKAGMAFRYLLALEAHESGLPHYHVLLHETGEPIRYRQLKSGWTYGFTQWKLVPDDERRLAGWYVAKYLTKHQAARVRASLHYGLSSALADDNPIDLCQSVNV